MNLFSSSFCYCLQLPLNVVTNDHRKLVTYHSFISGDSSDQSSGHGTHTVCFSLELLCLLNHSHNSLFKAGSIAGNARGLPGLNDFNGMAYEAKLAIYDFGSSRRVRCILSVIYSSCVRGELFWALVEVIDTYSKIFYATPTVPHIYAHRCTLTDAHIYTTRTSTTHTYTTHRDIRRLADSHRLGVTTVRGWEFGYERVTGCEWV